MIKGSYEKLDLLSQYVAVHVFLNSKFKNTVKPVLSSHSKIDIAKVLNTGGSLVQVKCIAECSMGVLTCIKRLSVFKTYFWEFFWVAALDRFYCMR